MVVYRTRYNTRQLTGARVRTYDKKYSDFMQNNSEWVDDYMTKDAKKYFLIRGETHS